MILFHSEAQAPPRGTIFLSAILLLVSSMSYLSVIKKANQKANHFLMEKHLISQKFQKSWNFDVWEIFSIFFM